MLRKVFTVWVIALSILAASLFVVPSPKVSASVAPECDKSVSFLGFPLWYKYLDVKVVNGKCDIVGPTVLNPNTGNQEFDFSHNIGRIGLALIEIVLRIGGLVAVGFVIYGGFKYILSQGEPDKAASARRGIINALIGLVIATLSTVIVSFIAGSLA